LAVLALALSWGVPCIASGQSSPVVEPAPQHESSSSAPEQPVPDAAEQAKPLAVRAMTVEDLLRAEITQLREEIQSLREALAQAQLTASSAARERDEIRQFLDEHEQLGERYEQYRAVVAVAERTARQQRAEEQRAKQEAQQAEARARMEHARALRDAQNAERDRMRRYERAGFYHVGQDVFVSAMAYMYKKEQVPDRTYRYFPRIRFDGSFFFTRSWYIDFDEEIDFSEMTISGSVVNASDVPRRMAVALTFFDRHGRQVGGETIEIDDARKDAPYPFTRTLNMALDGPFHSYRIVVLYADPIEPSADTSGTDTESSGGTTTRPAAAVAVSSQMN